MCRTKNTPIICTLVRRVPKYAMPCDDTASAFCVYSSASAQAMQYTISFVYIGRMYFVRLEIYKVAVAVVSLRVARMCCMRLVVQHQTKNNKLTLTGGNLLLDCVSIE